VPSISRWSSLDPVSFFDGPNLFRFVRNDPINSSDPVGLATLAQCNKARADIQNTEWYRRLLLNFQMANCFKDMVCRGNNADKQCKDSGASGYQRDGFAVLCYDNVTSFDENTIRHEMIHVFDFCAKRIGDELTDPCAVSSCKEIRAYMLDGDCAKNKSFESFWDCVFQSAVDSVSHSGTQCPPDLGGAEGSVCCVWKECSRLIDLPIGIGPPNAAWRGDGSLPMPKKCSQILPDKPEDAAKRCRLFRHNIFRPSRALCNPNPRPR
jgi:hypothetical protein